MKKTLLYILLSMPCYGQSQTYHAPLSLWGFPGVNWKYSSRNSLYAQAGYNPLLHMDALYVQAFLKVSSHITINPAYLYLGWLAPGPMLHEHTLMNAVIFSTPLYKWTIEDRNLLWNRFRNTGIHTNFYRNRFRVYLPPPSPRLALKLYVFDEAFYFIDRGTWTRNRIAAGAVYTIASKYIIDIFYAREHDRYTGETNLLFVMATFTIDHHVRATALPKYRD